MPQIVMVRFMMGPPMNARKIDAYNFTEYILQQSLKNRNSIQIYFTVIGQKVSNAGVSIHTLQYHYKCGFLPSAEYTHAGYRLYDAAAPERLQQALPFREPEFPLDLLSVQSPSTAGNKNYPSGTAQIAAPEGLVI